MNRTDAGYTFLLQVEFYMHYEPETEGEIAESFAEYQNRMVKALKGIARSSQDMVS